MRQALRVNQQRRAVSRAAMMQAPVKGWASEESYIEAEAGTAIVLDNWYPEADAVRLRRGCVEFANAVGGSVETLLAWRGAASPKLFAARSNGTIYDVTSGGAASSSYSTSRTVGKYISTMFATPAGQYLYLVNGADAAVHYNGTAWAVPTITGVTSSDLNYVWAHQNRLWFLEEASTDVWYLPVSSISGAASLLPIGGYLTRGGSLVAGGSWTLDSGTGVDDILVVVSSEGEVVVFAGTDPDNADTWALQGVYLIGKPIGQRCLHKVGGDLVVITDQGIVPISTALKTDLAAMHEAALTRRIRSAYTRAIDRARTAYGWQIETFPASQMALLNVPASGATVTQQFVYNVTTGAWSRFIGWDAVCWIEFDGELFFGTSGGKVFQAETGGSDAGAAITATLLPAFDGLGAAGTQKHVKMIRPIVQSDISQESLNVSVAAAVDYHAAAFVPSTVTPDVGWFEWDVSNWDADPWFGEQVTLDWRTGGNIGIAVSPAMRVQLSTATGDAVSYRLIGFQIAYEVGGIL